MGMVLASAVTAWGATRMLYVEAGVGLLGIAVFFAVATVVNRFGARTSGAGA
jgi:hypothetical protein